MSVYSKCLYCTTVKLWLSELIGYSSCPDNKEFWQLDMKNIRVKKHEWGVIGKTVQIC